MQHIVISFVGQDKPGLVEKLSNLISEHQGNWQNSSLHHLSGMFAGVIEVSAQSEQIAALTAALSDIEDLNVITQTTQAAKSESNLETVTLELTANDRTGIVQDISSVIHQQGGNLLKLVSKQGPAPHTGVTMFNAKAKIAVSASHLDKLIDALESIENDLMVDVSAN
ncbi:MAG: amino acid-binding protein [Thalassotalea sp.]|nr:amino acid-binding protein [Thalassotalea sp.]